MNCQERSGFLFAHACDRVAAWSCAACGKGICAEHTRLTEAGNVCIGCARGQTQAGAVSPTDPYFYDWDRRSAYDLDDYSAFDEPAVAAEEAESDLGAS